MAADKKTLLRDALKQVQGGKLDKAIETYKAIVKADPRDASVRNSLGDLYIKQGKKKDAIAEYLEASTLFEKDGFALRSIAICQKIVNLDPEQWSVRLKLADLYALQKLPAEARAIYLQVADRHDKKGEVAGALEIFRKIANLDPDNLPVRVKLAGMFEKQQKPVEAAEEYVRAAKGYAERKEADTAVQLYVRAFKLSPANLEARRRLADFYAQRQDWAVVVGLLETPVAKGSRDADLLVLYAEALTHVNHPLDAVKVLEKAQEREPNAVPVNLALGRALLKAGDTERGTEALNRCVGVHLAENRLEPAETLLREMAEVAPDDDKVAQRILEVAQKRGDPASIAQAYLKIAAIYERKGLVRSAVGALEKFLELKPGDPAVTQRLAELKSAAPARKIAPPPPAPVPPPEPEPPPLEEPAEEELQDVDLDDFVAVVDAAEEEELEIEIEGGPEAGAPPEAEQASVADARAAIARGAPGKAAAYLEEHLGAQPADAEAWEALVEARRMLGSETGVRDALLRLADLHRRSQRFEEARVAYKGALDIDPRNVIAARGLAALLEQEAKEAGPEAPETGASEEVEVYEIPEVLEIFEDEEFPEVPEVPIEEVPEASGIPEEAEIPGVLELPAEEVLAVQEVPGEEAAPEVLEFPEEDATPAIDEISFELFEEPPPPPPTAEVLPAAPPAPPVPEPAPEAPVEVAPPQAAAPPVVAPPAAEEVDTSAPQFWGLDDFIETPPAPPEPPSASPADAALTGFESLEEAGLELGDIAPAPPSEKIAIPETGTGTGEFEEFLAEANFYLQQGLLDEAEFLYAKLGRLSPGNPEIAAQLRRLEQLRGPAPAPPAPTPAPAPEPAAVPDLAGLEADLDLAFGGGPAAVEPPAALSETSSAADFSDFLSDLRSELEHQVEPSPPPPPPPQEEEGLAGIFQEFQRSVKEQLGDEDYETHYNLGIAYKEMGLLDEAIGEFALAEKSPVRRMNAVSMIALCLRELGRFDESAQTLRNGISLSVEGSEDQKGFLYDLAGLHEQAGRVEEAREALLRLQALDPGYRDVPARVGVPPPPAAQRKKPKVSYI